MQANVVQIGNSKGIRIPAAVLKQCGIAGKVELEITSPSIMDQIPSNHPSFNFAP